MITIALGRIRFTELPYMMTVAAPFLKMVYLISLQTVKYTISARCYFVHGKTLRIGRKNILLIHPTQYVIVGNGFLQKCSFLKLRPI